MNLSGTQIYLLIFASILYLFGVQLPTFRFNIPLNNTLQNLDIESLDESEATLSRVDFEIPWNRWNKTNCKCYSRRLNVAFTSNLLVMEK